VIDAEAWRQRHNRAVLAACRGTRDGLITNDHLGEAVRKYNYAARTLEGDTYETAFEWAREEKKRGQGS
jgi:hypothetical protein